MTVTVYTKSHCPACQMTKRHLARRGIPFTEAPLEDENTIAAAQSLGLRSAPIVCAEGGHNGERIEQVWDGYRPDRIDGLVA